MQIFSQIFPHVQSYTKLPMRKIMLLGSEIASLPPQLPGSRHALV